VMKCQYSVGREMKKFLKKIKQKLLSKYFWRNNRKRLLFVGGGIAVIILMMLLLIGGQRDIGTKEAGHQLNLLAQNIRHHYKTRPDFWGLSTKEVITKKMYPTTMIVEGDILKGYFGTTTTIGSDVNGTTVMPSGRQFVIAYHDLSKLQCIGLGSYKFNSDFWFGVTKMNISNSKGTQSFEWGNKEYKLPAQKAKLKKLCRQQNNTIAFYFE